MKPEILFLMLAILYGGCRENSRPAEPARIATPSGPELLGHTIRLVEAYRNRTEGS